MCTRDVNNYISFALVVVASKILVMISVELMESYRGTTDTQFGFKMCHCAHYSTYVFNKYYSVL